MGFSVEAMIADLEEILAKAQKASKTKRELAIALEVWKDYARKCGHIRDEQLQDLST